MNKKSLPPEVRRPVAVLCLFDYVATTGFATVSTNIVKELRRRFGDRLRLDIIPINYMGPEKEIWEDRFTRLIPLSEGEHITDPFGRYTALRFLNDGDYDGIFIIQDPAIGTSMVPGLLECRANKHKKNRPQFKSLFYFPIDSVPLDLFFQKHTDFPRNGEMVSQNTDLAIFDQLVTYTEYGRQEIIKKRPDLKTKVNVIPHGGNPSDFYPMPELRTSHEIRSTLFGDNAHKYIIINVNRNQYRKDIPTSLLGFKQFQDENPNIPAFLYLHMTSMEDMGWDIHLIAEQLGLVIGVDYDLPPVAQQNAGASMKQLRWLYNAADVFLTTTTGEGWGLTVAEAMMCKLPVIAPNTTSLVEIGGDGTRLWPLTEMYPYFAQWDSVQREQCSYYEVADLLLQVYNSPEIRHDKALAAYHFISTLTWEKVCDQWETQFRKLFF